MRHIRSCLIITTLFSTFVLNAQNPGGVSTDLSLWLKSDLSVFSDNVMTVAIDGANVEEWHDQGVGNNATQISGVLQPVFRNKDESYTYADKVITKK